MSSFIKDRNLILAEFAEELDLSRAEEISVNVKKILGESFEVKSIEFDKDKNSSRIVFRNDDSAQVLILDKDGFAAASVFIEDGVEDKNRLESLKAFLVKLLKARDIPSAYKLFLMSISGFYLPEGPSSGELDSKKAVTELLHKMLKRNVGDVVDFSLSLREKTDYGSRGIDYKVAQNDKTKLYALGVEVSCYMNCKPTLTSEEAEAYIQQIESMVNIEHERTVIDQLS